MRPNVKKSLVTGAAGFIGSHLVEALLKADQEVVGLDNLSTGSLSNLDSALAAVSDSQKKRFQFIQADIRDQGAVSQACSGVTTLFHQAAIASVPASLENPSATHDVNVTGFLNVLIAAKDHQVGKVVFASSSAVYGDCSNQVNETQVCRPLSPYAASKRVNEIYAETFQTAYSLSCVGLRYFNVYGPRQSPKGPYAAVIPLWIEALLSQRPAVIYGDGSSTRSFCYVKDVVAACLKAANHPKAATLDGYNIAGRETTDLNALFQTILHEVTRQEPKAKGAKPMYEAYRQGDILHSRADASAFQNEFTFSPEVDLATGLRATVEVAIKMKQ